MTDPLNHALFQHIAGMLEAMHSKLDEMADEMRAQRRAIVAVDGRVTQQAERLDNLRQQVYTQGSQSNAAPRREIPMAPGGATEPAQ